jgi:O-glycosyl hydrolase
MVRFGEPSQGIYMKGTWLNETFIRCKIPKYTKPDVLRVELTLNGKYYTNDGKNYGYFDPYVLNAEPRLISVEGTTIVRIKGFGFVNSSQTQSLYSSPNPSSTLLCNGK